MNTVRLLLVEDDAVSAQFLCEVLESVPASVVHAQDCAQALAHSRDASFDLWLVDANLPDGDGESLLPRLHAAANRPTPALALTADPFAERREGLLSAGFIAVLSKPIEAIELLEAVRAHLDAASTSAAADPASPATAAWDDAGALRAVGGRHESVVALRMLFARELPLDRDRVLQALQAGAHDELQDTLHRLKASCGFVGASQLLAAVTALSRAPGDREHRAAFEAACRSTLAGL